MMERTLVLCKPDAVQRGLVGRVISRFEDAGLKIIGLKMVWADKDIALQHYTEDLAKRRGQKVRDLMTEFIRKGPVVAFCLEGISAIAVVRKMVGETEPKAALPGTIRGDLAHVSFLSADQKNKAVPNLVHASGNAEDAQREIKVWFTASELHSYPRSGEEFFF